MFHTGVGYVQPVALGRCHIEMQKHPCDNIMSDTQCNALDLISVVHSLFPRRGTDILWLYHVTLLNG